MASLVLNDNSVYGTGALDGYKLSPHAYEINPGQWQYMYQEPKGKRRKRPERKWITTLPTAGRDLSFATKAEAEAPVNKEAAAAAVLEWYNSKQATTNLRKRDRSSSSRRPAAFQSRSTSSSSSTSTTTYTTTSSTTFSWRCGSCDILLQLKYHRYACPKWFIYCI